LSDDQNWHAPGGTPTPPPAEPAVPPAAPGGPHAAPVPPAAPQQAPAYGQQAPGYGQQAPGYGQQAPGTPFGGPQAGWTPPPKPGLVPLRPMTLGTILGGAFMVMRRNPKPTFGLALLITGFTFVLTLGISGGTMFATFERQLAAGNQADADAIGAGGIAAIALSLLIPTVLSIAAMAILQGIISLEVARGTVGEKMRTRGLWRLVKGRAWALIGWTMLIIGAATVALAILAVLIGLLMTTGTGGIVAGIGLILVIGAAAVVAAFWLGTRLAFVPSAIVVERLPVFQAAGRSWSLTKGYFWRTLGIILLVSAAYSIVSQLVTGPITLIASFLGSLLGMGDENTIIVLFIVIYGITILFSVLVGAIGVVVQSATAALLYVDLRMRKEGLDVELIRFVDARQAGDTSVGDPYTTPDDAAWGSPA